jgi:hypothetical protein
MEIWEGFGKSHSIFDGKISAPVLRHRNTTNIL